MPSVGYRLPSRSDLSAESLTHFLCFSLDDGIHSASPLGREGTSCTQSSSPSVMPAVASFYWSHWHAVKNHDADVQQGAASIEVRAGNSQRTSGGSRTTLRPTGTPE